MSDHKERELLSAFLDNELSGGERLAVESHLTSCLICADDLAGLSAAKALLSADAPVRMPSEARAALEQRFGRTTPGERLGAFLSGWFPRRWESTAAAAAVVVALASWGGFQMIAEEPLPLEPLLAAHSRYEAESLVSDGNTASSNYSAHLAAFYGE